MDMSKDLVAASATPLVLAILAEGDSYGYAIIKRVAELSGGHLQWTETPPAIEPKSPATLSAPAASPGRADRDLTRTCKGVQLEETSCRHVDPHHRPLPNRRHDTRSRLLR